MSKVPVLLVAAGGLARETLSAIRAAGDLEPIGLLDDDAALHGSLVGGVQVLGASADVVDHPSAAIVVCAGSGGARSSIVERLRSFGVGDDRYATVVHPRASVGANCTIGAGSILLANVVLTSDVTIGKHVVAMPNVTLTHDVLVEDFATLCAGVSLGGGVRVGTGAYLGMNASVRQGLRTGDRSVLGMGAVQLNDIPDEQIWAGVPARPIGTGQQVRRRTTRGVQSA